MLLLHSKMFCSAETILIQLKILRKKECLLELHFATTFDYSILHISPFDMIAVNQNKYAHKKIIHKEALRPYILPV